MSQHCDVAIVGAGLVGLSLAYELASLGASVAVFDAGHPGARPTPERGSSHRPRTRRRTTSRGRSCSRAAATTRRFSSGWPATVSTCRQPGTRSVARSHLACGRARSDGSAPTPVRSCGAAQARRPRSQPPRRPTCSHHLAPCTGSCMSPDRRAVDGRGMAAALAGGRVAPWGRIRGGGGLRGRRGEGGTACADAVPSRSPMPGR